LERPIEPRVLVLVVVLLLLLLLRGRRGQPHAMLILSA
jgi:hypothetical protein